MPGCIIEGVTASGKSTIFKRIQHLLAEDRPANTKLLVSEHYTERMLEHLKELEQLSEVRVLNHLRALLEPLLSLKHQKACSKFASRAGNTLVFAVFERFLLGHVANMRMQKPYYWSETKLLERQIIDLYSIADECGLARVVLRCEETELGERVLTTRAYRNEAWSAFLDGIGNDARIIHHYRTWQAHMLEFVEHYSSVVKPIFIEIKAGDDVRSLKIIADKLYAKLFV